MMTSITTALGFAMNFHQIPILADAQPAHALWITYVVAVLLAMCMIGVSLMTSKRSHRD